MMVHRRGPPGLEADLAPSERLHRACCPPRRTRLRSFAKAQEQAGINKCLLYSYHVCQTAPRHQGWEPARASALSCPVQGASREAAHPARSPAATRRSDRSDSADGQVHATSK